MTLFHLVVFLCISGTLVVVFLQFTIMRILKRKNYSGVFWPMRGTVINPIGTMLAFGSIIREEQGVETRRRYQRISKLYGIFLIGILVMLGIGVPFAYYFSYGKV